MKLLSALIVASLFAFYAPPAHAVLDVAKTCRIKATDGTSECSIGAGAGTITTAAWRTVISSATRALKGLYIYNSTPNFLKVAIGPSGSESVQIIVPPGTLPGGAYAGAPVGSYAAGQGFFYPLAISQGTKVAIESEDSDAAQGQVLVSEYFY